MKNALSVEKPERAAQRAARGISRRTALRHVGLGIGLLTGCSDDSSGEEGGGAGGANGAGGTVVVPGSSDVWATGGTAAMTDVESYPDPFAAATASCALLCGLTQGPCWAPSAPLRQDVSEGEPGIPLRLALRIVQADGCTPVPGAEVEIWYCNIDGLYSAEDVQALAFCTSNEEHAISGYFFRGRALSDDDGKLSFHGCFPGWYPGRSIHIHVLVRPAANAGERTTANSVAMSQLFFPEALTAEIFDTVAGYVDKGQPDTSFARDSIAGAVTDIAPFVVEYQRMTDGALLAWKTIAISAATSC
jgi:protocatechuate 3,4-dioxygenase beta subunit